MRSRGNFVVVRGLPSLLPSSPPFMIQGKKTLLVTQNRPWAKHSIHSIEGFETCEYCSLQCSFHGIKHYVRRYIHTCSKEATNTLFQPYLISLLPTSSKGPNPDLSPSSSFCGKLFFSLGVDSGSPGRVPAAKGDLSIHSLGTEVKWLSDTGSPLYLARWREIPRSDIEVLHENGGIVAREGRTLESGNKEKSLFFVTF